MNRDLTGRNAFGRPNGTDLERPGAQDLEEPGFLLIDEGQTLAEVSVAVFGHELAHELDRLARGRASAPE